MTLANIPTTLQPIIVLQYEAYIKTILMVGWFIFALYYLHYQYKKQEPTKIFFLGTFRASMYVSAWLYSWLFWLIYPVFIHPAVAVDQLLIFLAYSYTGIATIFGVIFTFNFTVWLPRIIYKFGKVDLDGFESHAVKNYFDKGGKYPWQNKKKK